MMHFKAKSIEIFYDKTNRCPLQNKSCQLFQLVYVISGSGSYICSKRKINYKSNDLFLLTPESINKFDVKDTSEFLLIGFKPLFIKNFKWEQVNHLSVLLNNSIFLTGSIINNIVDKLTIRSLMEAIFETEYNEENNRYKEELLGHLINALIVVVSRCTSNAWKQFEYEHEKRFVDIISFIHRNLNNPDNLRSNVISKKFNFSETYLGRYFKIHCQETMQSYIINARIKLIKDRLNFSEMKMYEIAQELNFIDSSHMNIFFKKKLGYSLSAYKDSING